MLPGNILHYSAAATGQYGIIKLANLLFFHVQTVAEHARQQLKRASKVSLVLAASPSVW